MMVSLVLTCIGPDKPGVVETISQTLTQHEANWQASNMAHLAGQFAGILELSVPTENAEALRQSLRALESTGLRFIFAEGSSSEKRSTTHLEVTSKDRPGIVQEVSRTLAAHSANVEHLETRYVAAAMTGETLFQAKIKLSLAGSSSLESLQKSLEELSDDLMVDIL